MTDMNEGSICSMTQLGVTESYKLKRQVVVSAIEAAEMILRYVLALFDSLALLTLGLTSTLQCGHYSPCNTEKTGSTLEFNGCKVDRSSIHHSFASYCIIASMSARRVRTRSRFSVVPGEF